MKQLLLIPNNSGPIQFALCGRTQSAKLRAYQHVLTILLSDSSGLYRTYGTGLLGLMQGSNNRASIIHDIANIACITAMRQLSQQQRQLISNIAVDVGQLDQTACSLIVQLTFTDGDTIRKEFA